MIEALADYLEDNGFGTLATNIFIGELPLNIAECIAVVPSLSPEPDKSIPYYRQTVDIWGKYESYAGGLSIFEQLFDFFHQKEHYDITGNHIYLSYSMAMVDYMGVDSQRRHLFKLSLGFLYRNSNVS